MLLIASCNGVSGVPVVYLAFTFALCLTSRDTMSGAAGPRAQAATCKGEQFAFEAHRFGSAPIASACRASLTRFAVKVADALFSMRLCGWLGEDEASRTQDEIEAKAKRDAQKAELKENPGLSRKKTRRCSRL